MLKKFGAERECGFACVKLGEGAHGYLLTRRKDWRPCMHCALQQEWEDFNVDDVFIHEEGCQARDCHMAPCGGCVNEECGVCGKYFQELCFCCGGIRTDEMTRRGEHDPDCEGS